MFTDPIADLLTRIRNSIQSKQPQCEVPATRIKESIVKILKEQGYIQNYVRLEDKPQDKLVIIHKYRGKNFEPVISSIRRVSRPGCRVYRGYKDIRPLLGGLGMAILSTPLGILSDVQARESRVGGEVLCEVW